MGRRASSGRARAADDMVRSRRAKANAGPHRRCAPRPARSRRPCERCAAVTPAARARRERAPRRRRGRGRDRRRARTCPPTPRRGAGSQGCTRHHRRGRDAPRARSPVAGRHSVRRCRAARGRASAGQAVGKVPAETERPVRSRSRAGRASARRAASSSRVITWSSPTPRTSSTSAGPWKASSGSVSLAGAPTRTCSGASACVPTCRLVVIRPTFTLAPCAISHAQPQWNGVSPGKGGVAAP